MRNNELKEELESIKKLLIWSLLKDGVSPEAIEIATGIKAKTVRNTFKMKYLKKTK